MSRSRVSLLNALVLLIALSAAAVVTLARQAPPGPEMKPADRPAFVTARHNRAMTAMPLGAGLLHRSSFLPARSASSIIACLFGIAPGGGYRVSP